MNPKHQSGYSNIRVISCIAICILHTFFAAASIFQPDKDLYAASYAVRNAMYFAVPCFVMVTGALLLDPAREIGFSKLFGRYIRRILLALVIFTLLFALFDAVTKGETVGPAALKDWLFALFFDKSWAHMWYLYMLLGLYLLLPFYRKAAAASDRTELRYLLLVYLVFQSGIPLITRLSGNTPGFYISVYTVYPLYLFLGYALKEGAVRIPRGIALLLVLAGTAAIAVPSYLAYAGDLEAVQKIVGNYSYPGVIAQAAGAYALIDSLSGDGAVSRLLQKIDENSFGIYLIHMVFLKLVTFVWKWNPYAHGGLLMVLGLSLAVFAVSWAAVWLLRKIPGVKKVL